MTMIFSGAQSKEELNSSKYHQEQLINEGISQLISQLLANDKLEKIFLAIYTFEMFIKIIARGFAAHEFAYLRSGWNCMDFVIIVVAYAQSWCGIFGCVVKLWYYHIVVLNFKICTT